MRSFAVVPIISLALLLGGARGQDGGDNKPQEGPEVEMAKSMVKLLKAELELSDDQADKVSTAIQDGIRAAFKQAMKHMGEEEPDEEAIAKERDEIRDGILGKVRGVLDDTQKKEFEVLIKEFDQRAGQFERASREAPGGDALVWLEGELPTKERLLLKAENCLLLNEDEKKVVLPKVDAVVSARMKLREVRREQRRNLAQAVRAGAKEDEVRERLHSLRNRQVELARELAKAQEELRELVTIDQEARLVAIAILD